MKFIIISLLSILFFGIRVPNKDKGIEIYRVYQVERTIKGCNYCFQPKSEDLFKEPLLTENDIKNFDWDKQQIVLTQSGITKIKELEIPLSGMPVAMVLNGEVIYGFWFWELHSSFGCDYVYTYPQLNFEIKFGLPESYRHGNDPRFDERIENYILSR